MKQVNSLDFKPPIGLRNRHIQTMFSSVGFARIKTSKLRKQLAPVEQHVVIRCDDDIRLNGLYTQAGSEPSNKMVTLIHGWEGSVNSSYMVSAAKACLDAGIDMVRLNLRDHGESHHLNEGVFNSTLLPEVIDAVEQIQSLYPRDQHYLGGFSLGGSFALRVAAKAHDRAIKLHKVITFCAALDPYKSNGALSEPQHFIYNQYFTQKWRRSLLKKQKYHSQYQFNKELKGLNNLDKMNDALIPKYTGFSDIRAYFQAYTITEDYMASTICPCHMYYADDEPIILSEDITRLADNPNLHVYLSKYGGHCGYVKDWRFNSLQDELLVLQIMND